MLKPPRRIVVDASIARAAGPEESTYPTSMRCREFLKALLDCRHSMVMTSEIAAEWKKHHSGFARRWRVAMEARKLICRLDIQHDAAMRTKVSSCCPDEFIQGIVLKDYHLIEAAQASDRTVSALDDRVRGHLANISHTVKPLALIAWVNPDQDDKVVGWLHDGAPDEPARRLGNYKK